MKKIVVIPARLSSTRLPRKPLIDIKGKSLIQRTWEQTIKAIPQNLVYIATDHEDIFNHCKMLGMQVVMTPNDCLTGTDRVAFFSTLIDADYYINVQGDEPLMNPKDIIKMYNAIDQFPTEILNGFTAIKNEEEYRNLSIPKVVIKNDQSLLYMSRSPIPGNKNDKFSKSWRQICIYCFPKRSLEIFASQKSKTALEKEEDIEILRFLELGLNIRMIELSSDSIAVDNPEDINKVVDKLNEIEK